MTVVSLPEMLRWLVSHLKPTCGLLADRHRKPKLTDWRIKKRKVQEQNTARLRTPTALILQPALWRAASGPNHHLLRSSPQTPPRTPQRADHARRSPYHQAGPGSHCVSRGLRVVP